MCNSCSNNLFGNEYWWIIAVIAIILIWGCSGSGCGGTCSAAENHCCNPCC